MFSFLISEASPLIHTRIEGDEVSLSRNVESESKLSSRESKKSIYVNWTPRKKFGNLSRSTKKNSKRSLIIILIEVQGHFSTFRARREKKKNINKPGLEKLRSVVTNANSFICVKELFDDFTKTSFQSKTIFFFSTSFSRIFPLATAHTQK